MAPGTIGLSAAGAGGAAGAAVVGPTGADVDGVAPPGALIGGSRGGGSVTPLPGVALAVPAPAPGGVALPVGGGCGLVGCADATAPNATSPRTRTSFFMTDSPWTGAGGGATAARRRGPRARAPGRPPHHS